MESELLPLANDLVNWIRDNKEVRAAAAKVMTKRGYTSIGQMAHENPELFLEFHDAMKTMLEELPHV